LIPLNDRVIIINHGLEVEGREVCHLKSMCYKKEIISFFGGMRANFGEEAAKQEFKFYFRLAKIAVNSRRKNQIFVEIGRI
jgi:hypothetical protein